VYLHYNSYPHPRHTRSRSSMRTLYVASSSLGAVLQSPPILELNPQIREAVTARYSRSSHSAHSISGHLEATRGRLWAFLFLHFLPPLFLAQRYRAKPVQNRLHQLQRRAEMRDPHPTTCCCYSKRSSCGLARLLWLSRSRLANTRSQKHLVRVDLMLRDSVVLSQSLCEQIEGVRYFRT